MLYTVNLDNDNFVLSVAHTPNDNVEINNLEDNKQYLHCCRLIGNLLVIDRDKKAAYEAKIKKEETEKRKAELHSLLNESDYIIARTFEQVMSCTNPLTFITDIIAIITKFSAQYGEVIANRQTWRDELEAMEATDNEQ